MAALPAAHAESDGTSSPAAPNTAKPNTETIVIEGKRLSDTEERRYSTAAKMVFGREELDRQGDTTIAEVLKRLPGVTTAGTPGRGGDIRMRGLGKSYTQILLNGEPMPRGFSLDTLSPEQVERIEIMRGPVAEYGARAIAGTINIVLREGFARKGNEARLNFGYEGGHFQPGVFLQRDDRIGALNYNVTANVSWRDLPSTSVTQTTAVNTATGLPTLAQTQRDDSHNAAERTHISGRLNWRLDAGDSITLQPFLMQSRSHGDGTTNLTQSLGATPAPHALATSHSDSQSQLLRAFGTLRLSLADGARLEMRLSGGQWASDSSTTRRQYDSLQSLVHAGKSDSDVEQTTVITAGKYSRPWRQDHKIAAGWDIEIGNRQETARVLQDGSNPLSAYGDDFKARTTRLALYAQDEWDVSPLWSVYGGLRGETIRTASNMAMNSGTNVSTVFSPLLHSVWRFSPESKDQVRLGLTRSYRSPNLSDLVARPSLSADYPVAGANTATSPDSVGNPGLKPELAWGLDLAYEHYLGAGGLISASIFRRSIDNLIRNVKSLQSVSWSPVPRWVSSPRNLGSATSRGVELEAKFRFDEWNPEAPPINLRANYSRFWSDVAHVPGPNNRLDQQPTWTANLGADYRLRGLPLTLGASLNWTPAFVVQQTEAQRYYQGIKRVLDTYVLWKLSADAQLRFSAANWQHADYRTANEELFGSTDQLASTVQKTYPSYAARLEIKF